MFPQFKSKQSGEGTAPILQVYLLGPPHIQWAGRPLMIPRRQARALLYHLATRLHPIPREQLCYLFWPDTLESTARRNLSRLLTHLRRTLPLPELLLTEDDHVRLEPDQTWSDTAIFERLCVTKPDPYQAEAYQQAVDLYRGPFLTGFSLPAQPEFEAWIVQEQQTWEHLYLKMLATLIKEQMSRGAYDLAIAYARCYLAVDDLAEEIHRRLMILYAATGDRGAALRQFKHCTEILEGELGISPLPKTWATYQAVMTGQPVSGP